MSSRAYPNRPYLGVLAAVRRGGRVLLLQRAIPPDQGKWGLPGGMLELGETVFQGAMRELAEETQIEAEPVDILTVLDFIEKDEAEKVRYHFALIVVLAEWRSGEGVPDADAMGLGWFTPEELPGMATSAATERVMRLALGR